MRPGDQYRCGRERTDAGLLEQLRRQLPRERLDLACELALLNGQCLDAPGESAERKQRPAQLRILAAFRTDRREPAQELRAEPATKSRTTRRTWARACAAGAQLGRT
ncbi:MAG: hypothetical protein M3Q61_07185 [Chloroflexota bacterium]|nr:hypothetical protein [Chloroflexota bacterium]